MVTPQDIVNYIFEKGLEYDFLTALTCHKDGYSIGEIVDRKYRKKDDGFYLISKSYNLNLVIPDEDVQTALHNGLYVSTFISRHEDNYQVHFLVHKYPENMKSQFEEEIMNEVLHYMIVKTVIALRLDSEKKVDAYIK